MDDTVLTGSGWAFFVKSAEVVSDKLADDFFESESNIPLSAWRDEISRLRVWAKDVGIYPAQTRPNSLNIQLDRLPLVKKQILRQLTRIRHLYDDLWEEIAPGGRQEVDADSEKQEDPGAEDQEAQEKPRTAIQDIYMHLEESINGLNRMSAILAQRFNADDEDGHKLEPTEEIEEAQSSHPLEQSRGKARTEAAFPDYGGGSSGLEIWFCVSSL
ncbi:hypothetical protein BDV06DRAFT_194313 [Aspergillus oleicola]